MGTTENESTRYWSLGQALRIMRLLHYAMWTWLSENPDKNKLAWPGWRMAELMLPTHYSRVSKAQTCFACAASVLHACGLDTPRTGPVCTSCPIVWEDEYGVRLNTCMSDDSSFSQWCDAGPDTLDLAARTLNALRIRDAWPLVGYAL